jgi:hypothetical protein
MAELYQDIVDMIEGGVDSTEIAYDLECRFGVPFLNGIVMAERLAAEIKAMEDL